jgi:hypothetical protein
LAEILIIFIQNDLSIIAKAMKKIILISFISLFFLAAGAQRPARSKINETADREGKKSEMTVNRPVKPQSRSSDNKSDHHMNRRSGETRTNDRIFERPGNNRNSGSMHDKREYNQNNRNDSRNVTDKIIRNKTDLHKNIRTERSEATINTRNVPSSSSGRDHSINSRNFERERKTYHSPDIERVHRKVYHVKRPRSIEYRRIHYAYRVPKHINIVWTPRMYRQYVLIYPEFRYWYYPYGYRIRTISAYDAAYYVGDVANVYGNVYEAWYSWQTDEYYLYFGAPYPHHDFSVVIPGKKARQFNRNPEIFFKGRYIWVTGLISLYDGKPEMIVREKHQIHLY